MIYGFILPLLIGVMGVLQNALNKKYALNLGLPNTLHLNNVILLCCSVVLFLALQFFPSNALPEIFKAKTGLEIINWRYAIPGILGFTIILLAPIAIDKVGTTKVFLGIIAAQILGSLLWDKFVENNPPNTNRIVGAILACIGATLASL